MAAKDFVPVAGDDWYQRRRQDAEGRFFREVADQGPRKGEGGSTRQGIYCLTAGGKLLAYKNAGQAPDVMRDVLKQALAAYRKLPAADRRAGAVAASGPADRDYSRTPPPGGLIVRVYTRILDRDDKGNYSKATCDVAGADLPARDHLWLTAAEWKELIPADPRPGERFPVPDRIAGRIVRFHLTDNTRGEPPLWRRSDVRSRDLTLTVEDVTPARVRLRLEGWALMATAGDASRADRGFDVRLLGYVEYDRGGKAINRFDVVAVGDHWGEGRFTRKARPGRAPLGVVFEMARGDSPADQVPPQGAREFAEYFAAGR
jgi:hypothetical protein